jgi:hypothetical protein
MAELEKLLKQLRVADKKHDLDKLDRVRAEIIEQFSDAPQCCEARYRLGLSKLLRHKAVAEAEQLFLAAAQDGDPLYSPMARTSYALLLHAQKRDQKALFELRKVVSSRKPTMQSAMAMAFIVQILVDTQAKSEEIERARKQHLEQLQRLYRDALEPVLKVQVGLQLGLVLIDAGDKVAARNTLEAVIGSSSP